MVMSSTVQVDTSAVRSAARAVSEGGAEVEVAADRVGAALRQVADASGHGVLPDSAHTAAREWGEGLTELTGVAAALSTALDWAASAYEMLEERATRRFPISEGMS